MNDYDLNVCNIIIIFLKVGRRNEISFFFKSGSQQGQLTKTAAVRWFFPRTQTGPVQLLILFWLSSPRRTNFFYRHSVCASNCGNLDEELLNQLIDYSECPGVPDTKPQQRNQSRFRCVFSSSPVIPLKEIHRIPLQVD